jgi:serine O-acetyltransferase
MPGGDNRRDLPGRIVSAAHPETVALISAEVADWSRERKALLAWDPARSLLASLRAYQRHRGARSLWGWAMCKLAVLRHRFWSVVTGADIPLNCRIAGGLVMPHPNGIVIHPDAVIGPNCLIFQQVTIGIGNDRLPLIKGHVDIGAGAKLLGGIVVGAHAKIGANAVVLRDVPEAATAVGVPAKIIKELPRRGLRVMDAADSAN